MFEIGKFSFFDEDMPKWDTREKAHFCPGVGFLRLL